MNPKIGQTARFAVGQRAGRFVRIRDDRDHSHGFLVETAIDPQFEHHAFDSWIAVDEIDEYIDALEEFCEWIGPIGQETRFRAYDAKIGRQTASVRLVGSDQWRYEGPEGVFDISSVDLDDVTVDNDLTAFDETSLRLVLSSKSLVQARSTVVESLRKILHGQDEGFLLLHSDGSRERL